MRLFEYAIILNEKYDKDDDVVEEAQLIVEPTHVLVRDEAQAGTIAARAIPDEYIDRLDRIVVAVRPF